MRRVWSVLLSLLLAAALPGCLSPDKKPRAAKYVETRPVMGTIGTVTLISADGKRAVAAMDAAFAALDSVNALMSSYLEGSELSAINAGAAAGPVAVSPATYDVLEQARSYHRISHGAFDVTVRPLLMLWRRGAAENRIPTPDEIRRAGQLVGSEKLQLDPGERTVRLAAEGMGVDLGGIAKGYGIDRAVQAARAAGISDGLVEVGGDLRLFGRIPAGQIGKEALLPVIALRRRSLPSSPDTSGVFPGIRRTDPVADLTPQPWPLGIQNPFGDGLLGKMRVPEGAVATSGHYQRYVTINGQHFSHIVDPRTGRPVDAPASVTVIAPTALAADALATAITVLGAERGIALADSLPGVEVLVVTGTAQGLELHSSAGFPEIERTR